MIARGEGCRERKVREFGMDTYTPLYLKWITSKDLLYCTGNSAQCYVAAWVGEEFRGEWIPVCVWLSCFAVHPKLSQQFELAILPTENKKFITKNKWVLKRWF